MNSQWIAITWISVKVRQSKRLIAVFSSQKHSRLQFQLALDKSEKLYLFIVYYFAGSPKTQVRHVWVVLEQDNQIHSRRGPEASDIGQSMDYYCGQDIQCDQIYRWSTASKCSVSCIKQMFCIYSTQEDLMLSWNWLVPPKSEENQYLVLACCREGCDWCFQWDWTLQGCQAGA